MDEPPYRFEFAVPDEVDVQEPPPPGMSVFEGEVVPSPVLERLRAALGEDHRWSLGRVSPLWPDDRHPDQRVVVWVSAELGTADADVRAGVSDVVTDVIPGARLASVERTGM